MALIPVIITVSTIFATLFLSTTEGTLMTKKNTTYAIVLEGYDIGSDFCGPIANKTLQCDTTNTTNCIINYCNLISDLNVTHVVLSGKGNNDRFASCYLSQAPPFSFDNVIQDESTIGIIIMIGIFLVLNNLWLCFYCCLREENFCHKEELMRCPICGDNIHCGRCRIWYIYVHYACILLLNVIAALYSFSKKDENSLFIFYAITSCISLIVYFAKCMGCSNFTKKKDYDPAELYLDIENKFS